jgi:hypothetical protein
LPDLIGGFAVDDQRIVNKQFAAGRNVGERVDEDTITRLNRFAVRCACVIQEACAVATATAINHPSVRESEGVAMEKRYKKLEPEERLMIVSEHRHVSSIWAMSVCLGRELAGYG